jgi:hypothetical protein
MDDHDGLVSNYCRNPDPVRKTIFCYTTDPLVEIEDCVPLRDYMVHYPITTIETDNHMINITDGIQPTIASLTNTNTAADNPLQMNLEMHFSALNIDLTRDYPERTIYL